MITTPQERLQAHTRILRSRGLALPSGGLPIPEILDSWGRCAEAGLPIDPERPYWYLIERGPVPEVGAVPPQNGVQLRGKTLLDLAADDYSDPVTLQQSKALMRMLINHYLGDHPLHTRQLLRDLHQL